MDGIRGTGKVSAWLLHNFGNVVELSVGKEYASSKGCQRGAVSFFACVSPKIEKNGDNTETMDLVTYAYRGK